MFSRGCISSRNPEKDRKKIKRRCFSERQMPLCYTIFKIYKEMLSFQVKFWTDRKTDGQTVGQQYNSMPLIYQYESIKILKVDYLLFHFNLSMYRLHSELPK